MTSHRQPRRLNDKCDGGKHTSGMEDERPPICPTCGVTMVPGALSAYPERAGDWVCLECEEAGEPDAS